MDNETDLMMQAIKVEKSHGAVSSGLCDFSHAMEQHDQGLYQRLIRLKPDGWSEAAWTRKAGVSSSFFQDLKKKNTTPRIDNLEKILAAIGLTYAEFEAHNQQAHRPTEPSALAAPSVPFRPMDLPRDVPVLGTAEGGRVQLNGNGDIQPTIMELTEIVDYLRRPPGISERRDVYALYIVGSSMEPRYYPGDPVYVDPRRQPNIGDDVILQLHANDNDEDRQVATALVKTLVRRTADYYELQQYQPDKIFRIDRDRVAAIHRVIPLRELFGI